jgi:diaminopropionate ammonia-lyase
MIAGCVLAAAGRVGQGGTMADLDATAGPGKLPWYARPAARDWRTAAPSQQARQFHAGLPGYAPTPLTEVPALAAELGTGRVLVKDESARLGLPAFKILGASWAVATAISARAGLTGTPDLDGLRAAAADRPVTLVTATDGNHGRAVARMAALLELPAQVFVPDVTPARLIAAIESEGASVTVVGGSYDDAVARAAAEAGRPGALLVQDTAWPGYEQIPALIVEGYQTLLHEADSQLGGPPDLIAVPTGVGSLLQAVLERYRSPAGLDASGRAPSVLAVEPATAACLLASLAAGELRSIGTAATIMTGLNCGTASSLCWPVAAAGLDAAVAVTDAMAAQAAADLAAAGISSGPSGAAALAGVRAALAGPGAAARRAQLAAGPESAVVLLSTERAPSGPAPG